MMLSSSGVDMSIYATLWSLQFPRGDDVEFSWVEVLAQGVPAHVGTPSAGYGYENGDPYSEFLPPAIVVADDGDLAALRAVVFVVRGSKKGTPRSGQEYQMPLLVLDGAEYDRIPFQALHDRICAALRDDVIDIPPTGGLSH